MTSSYPLGAAFDITYPAFSVRLTVLGYDRLQFAISDGPFARTETVSIQVIPMGNACHLVSWQEADGSTVVNLQDFDRERVFSFATLPDGRFLRMEGDIAWVTRPSVPIDDRPHKNRALVLDAMTSLFQNRDVSAVERLYAADYVQHNPALPQGRAALAELLPQLPPNLFYEPGLIVAQDAWVAIHGRIRGWADAPQVVIDLFRIENGKLAEHWDVLQVEAAPPQAGSPAMFDPGEAGRQA